MRRLWGIAALSLAAVLTSCCPAGHVAKTTPTAGANEPAVDPVAAEARAIEIVKARPGTFVWRLGDSVSIAFTGWPEDEELAQLQHVRKLRTLDICTPEIPKGGLAKVAGLTGVYELHLSASTTDSDLAPLKEMKGLQSLSLSGARITDSGLDMLGSFPTLREVRLYGCDQVTKAGIARLQKKRIPVFVKE